MKRLIILCGIACLLCLQSCAGAPERRAAIEVPDVGERTPWTHLRVNNNPDDFQFAIIADLTGGERPGVFEAAVRKLGLLQPEFVMSIGDLIQGMTDDAQQVDAEWEEFGRRVAGLQMPFFHVPGNHDAFAGLGVAAWQERFGPLYYHFVYRDVLFLCLNTEGLVQDLPEGEPDAQVQYACKVLAGHSDARWTFVFMHKPLWLYGGKRWEQIEQSLKGHGHTVFAGHHHRYVKYVRHGHSYIDLATTGGRSGLEGPEAGQFDHVVWVTVKDAGPVIANLLLEGILDEDVRTEPKPEVPDAAQPEQQMQSP